MNDSIKYRKKPIVIDAIQLTWENWNHICEFIPKPFFIKGCYVDKINDEETQDASGRIGLLMQTQNTQQFLAVENDWICKGVNGEYYPCKPDIFTATYEAVVEPSKETA